MRFRLNVPKVIHEQFDDEIVIANLESGRYYSTDQTGASIWALAIAGNSSEEIAVRMRAEFAGDPGEIERNVRDFLDELREESLVIAEPNETGVPASSVAAFAQTETKPFIPPSLQKYTDMEELLMLDPVHEVDEMGWPRKREP